MTDSSRELNEEAADGEIATLLYQVPLREVWDIVNSTLGVPQADEWTLEFERERIEAFVDGLGDGYFWAFKRGRRLRKIPVELLASLTWDDLSGFAHVNDPLRGRDNQANSLFVVRDDKAIAYEDWSESYIYIERGTAKRALEKLQAKPQCEEPPIPKAAIDSRESATIGLRTNISRGVGRSPGRRLPRSVSAM